MTVCFVREIQFKVGLVRVHDPSLLMWPRGGRIQELQEKFYQLKASSSESEDLRPPHCSLPARAARLR